MIWSKMKQQLESFLCPQLIGRVEYINTSYRYTNDQSGRSYITVDKKQIFNMADTTHGIKWYTTKEEIIKDDSFRVVVRVEDIEEVKRTSNGNIPEERFLVIAQKRKIVNSAEKIIASSGILKKTDFYAAAEKYLSSPLEDSLYSEDILLNIFALMDRRLGKKRIADLKERMQYKHPVVQYFYELRKNS